MNVIIRGSTPTHAFTIPVTAAELKAVRVTYRQNDGLIIEKEMVDCTIEEGYLYVKLTQQETYKLDHTLPTDVQLKLQFTDGDVAPSQIIRCTVIDSLNQEVLP